MSVGALGHIIPSVLNICYILVYRGEKITAHKNQLF